MIWCVDTSAWIDAVRFYNPASPLFAHLWAFLEQAISDGRVIAPKAVHEELKEKTLDDSVAFASVIKRVKGRLFVEETASIQARFAAITIAYPDLTRKGKPFAKSDADGWVIALAAERDAVIVSQETPKPSALVPYKLPDVARAFGLSTIRLDSFINAVQAEPVGSERGGVLAPEASEAQVPPEAEPE
ncbi:MAG: DUF4411 family protein [Vicinamibacteria bacterium]